MGLIVRDHVKMKKLATEMDSEWMVVGEPGIAVCA